MRTLVALFVTLQFALSSAVSAGQFEPVTSDCELIKATGGVELGTRVFEDAVSYAVGLGAVILKEGQLKSIDLPGDVLDCTSARRNSSYPIVFQSWQHVAQLKDLFGISVVEGEAFGPGAYLSDGSYRCFLYGAGQEIHLQLTATAVEQYKARGFSEDTVCLVLQSGQIHFDPVTGERLPTYVVAESGFVSPEFLFDVPNCFKAGVVQRESDFVAQMRPIGCKLVYHPWSGRQLRPDESQVLSAMLSLWAGAEGGSSTEDSEQLAEDSNRRATSAKLDAVNAQLTK